MKKALVTGASSGMGLEMAKILSERGYSLVLVARRDSLLSTLSKELKTPSEIVCADLSDKASLRRLFNEHHDIDILVNNAGLGVFGEFDETDFSLEENMLDVNIRAVHFLTKNYLREFKKRGSGKILNVSSAAAFMPGPLFSSYYASKAYVLRLTLAIREELRREKSPVTVSVLCPGPVLTDFNSLAGVNAGKGALTAKRVAKEGIDGLMKGKKVIIPGLLIKCTVLLSKLLPEFIMTPLVYNTQSRKKR